MAFGFGARIRPTPTGEYTVDLEMWERDLLRTLPGQLRDLLASDDPALERLFPPAYLDDDERNDEYRRLMRDDLTDARLSSLAVLEATLDEKQLDEAQLTAWMGALNDLRLVLGTRLEVTEDMYDDEFDDDDPRSPGLALYSYLGYLQENVVQALSSGP